MCSIIKNYEFKPEIKFAKFVMQGQLKVNMVA